MCMGRPGAIPSPAGLRAKGPTGVKRCKLAEGHTLSLTAPLSLSNTYPDRDLAPARPRTVSLHRRMYYDPLCISTAGHAGNGGRHRCSRHRPAGNRRDERSRLPGAGVRPAAHLRRHRPGAGARNWPRSSQGPFRPDHLPVPRGTWNPLPGIRPAASEHIWRRH